MPTTPYEFNFTLQIDVLEDTDVEGERISFVNIVCDGTTFQLVVPLRFGGGNPSGEEMWAAFTRSWVAWAGMPYRVWMDQGRPNLGIFRQRLIEHGVHVDFTALEQHHQLGRCEHHGGIWKRMWERVVEAHQIGKDA